MKSVSQVLVSPASAALLRVTLTPQNQRPLNARIPVTTTDGGLGEGTCPRVQGSLHFWVQVWQQPRAGRGSVTPPP